VWAYSHADTATQVSFELLNTAGPENKLIYRITGGQHCFVASAAPGTAGPRDTHASSRAQDSHRQQGQKSTGLAPSTLCGPPTPTELVLLLETQPQAFLPHAGICNTNPQTDAMNILL